MSDQNFATAESCPESTQSNLSKLFSSRSHSVFSRTHDLISKVSQEIKDYEDYLRFHKIVLEFGMALDADLINDPQLRYDGNSNVKYAIHWGKLEGQKEYRLYYERTGTGYETDEGCTSDYPILELRPIVEAPVEVRIFLRRWLNAFNERFTDYLEYVDGCNFEPLPNTQY